MCNLGENGREMWIRKLEIENFRGIQNATVEFSERQTVFVGANGAGKSTIIESLALLFGRDRLVRNLTEHDFFGRNPKSVDRVRLIATISGFVPNSSFRPIASGFRQIGDAKVASYPLAGNCFPNRNSDQDKLYCPGFFLCPDLTDANWRPIASVTSTMTIPS